MMMSGVFSTLAVATALFLTVHVAVWRRRPSNAPRILLLASIAGASMAAVVVVRVLSGGLGTLDLCAVLWIYAFLIVAYLFLYAGISRSVSVTLLERIQQAGGKQVEIATLVTEYATSSLFEDRVRLMHDSGMVSLSGGVVTLRRKGAIVARCAQALSRVIGSELRG